MASYGCIGNSTATHPFRQVRLDLEKKLAASSQKFSDAARLSAQLKAGHSLLPTLPSLHTLPRCKLSHLPLDLPHLRPSFTSAPASHLDPYSCAHPSPPPLCRSSRAPFHLPPSPSLPLPCFPPSRFLTPRPLRPPSPSPSFLLLPTPLHSHMPTQCPCPTTLPTAIRSWGRK